MRDDTRRPIPRRRPPRTTIALVVVLGVMLVACAGAGPDDADAPPSAGDDPGLVVDWETRSVTGDTGALDVRFCEGEGPFLCIERDGTVIGVVERLTYDVTTMDVVREALASGATPVEALERHAAAQVATFAADRRAGCGPDHLVTGDATEPVPVGGEPGLRFGWTTRRADVVVERVVSWATIIDGSLDVLVAAALADDGCLERLGEFSIADLDAALPTLERVARGSRFADGTAPLATAERVVTARIVAIDAAGPSITFTVLEVLTGQDARAAAVAAGAIAPGEDVPNDYWLREVGTDDETLPIDPAARVEVQDCTSGCRPVPIDLATFLREQGRTVAGVAGVFEVTIANGTVTGLVEVYFP